ncbi:major tail protein [Alkalicoccobacillus gibsonii]|uniref:major tail protein n=1 Tax=Alkalicoccobacillus gibsonii TaxID=79881 RepID=UPI001931B77E|nr:major tail protein [Alkalicoccobacillus gibsonii]MBM0064782.1 phage tail protein [Alkalicoccobacillus gibsonii]
MGKGSSTGVTEFYYRKHGEAGIPTGKVYRVPFLQDITVEQAVEVFKAYGDNRTAEVGQAIGDITVTSTFHSIDDEHKVNLFGVKTRDGITVYSSDDVAPYVSVIFAKTYENGDKEWVGLYKGIASRGNIEGSTKEGGGGEFSSEEISFSFMERELDNETLATAYDKKGETTNKEALFAEVFGADLEDTPAGA